MLVEHSYCSPWPLHLSKDCPLRGSSTTTRQPAHIPMHNYFVNSKTARKTDLTSGLAQSGMSLHHTTPLPSQTTDIEIWTRYGKNSFHPECPACVLQQMFVSSVFIFLMLYSSFFLHFISFQLNAIAPVLEECHFPLKLYLTSAIIGRNDTSGAKSKAAICKKSSYLQEMYLHTGFLWDFFGILH